MSARTPAAKQLTPLLSGVACTIAGGREDVAVTGLCLDSRTAQPGNLFAAVRGFTADGHNFLDQAVAAGCTALLVNRDWQASGRHPQTWPGIAIVEVDDTKSALGHIAANYYDHPEQHLTVIGITGTNGKTTTSFLTESLLKACGRRPGVIGTVNYRYVDKNNNHIEMAAPFTTPESPTLFGLLRTMVDAGATDVVMEVSSHALAQSRLSGLLFDIGAFTNLSRDHLDFHADMQHYFSSKRLLFTNYLKPGGRIVIMLDDAAPQDGMEKNPAEPDGSWSRRLHEELRRLLPAEKESPPIITCGLGNDCDIHPQHATAAMHGTGAEIMTPAGPISLATPLVGEFNLRNILCALGIGLAHDEKLDCMKKGLEDVKNIPGRLERVGPQKPAAGCPAVFVDYAHTPDALANVLTALRQLEPGRLVCVFGCGGDRDTGKRSLMGEVAGRLCDVVLATSDNPRSESPAMILAQIETGLAATDLKRAAALQVLRKKNGRGWDIIENRRQAIHTAVRYGGPDDVILISGKGHENYQISAAGRIFFDDRIEAEMQLQAKAGLPFAWKLEWVRQITGARLLVPARQPVTFRNISTDSRTVEAGDLFVALQGENYDGRMFAEKAVARGAAGILANSETARNDSPLDFRPPVPVLLVPDTVAAIGRLAGSLRRWYYDLRVIAVTGSSGKTTVKEMTGAILGQGRHILKTEGNFNNLVGLPLTLFRLQPQHEIAILEMGMNRPGEIARLTEIADPDIACIINIQEAHLEGLGDISGVAQAKNELFAGLKADGKVAVNLDDPLVSSLAEGLPQEKITFGFHPAAVVRATDLQSLGEAGMAFVLHVGSRTRRVAIKGLGRHNVANGLAAAALAHAAGSTIDEISSGLAAFTPYDKRSRIEALPSGVKVLNDCYNANPASMLAALTTLVDLKNNHRAVAVLGDMLELGSASDEAHLALGCRTAAMGIDFLAAFGPQAEKTITGARNSGMSPAAARGFTSKKELVDWLRHLLRDNRIAAGDWLLIKGSRGMRMEEVLALLHLQPSSSKAAGN